MSDAVLSNKTSWEISLCPPKDVPKGTARETEQSRGSAGREEAGRRGGRSGGSCRRSPSGDRGPCSILDTPGQRPMPGIFEDSP